MRIENFILSRNRPKDTILLNLGLDIQTIE